jgi:cell filamentation protein
VRKYSPESTDPYLDLDSGILRNLVGAVTEERLETLEATLVSVRAYELAPSPEPGSFDLMHLQRIHRRLFQDVYDGPVSSVSSKSPKVKRFSPDAI